MAEQIKLPVRLIGSYIADAEGNGLNREQIVTALNAQPDAVKQERERIAKRLDDLATEMMHVHYTEHVPMLRAEARRLRMDPEELRLALRGLAEELLQE